MCGICYVPFVADVISIASFIAQATFGLSVSDHATMGKSLVGQSCSQDYIEIPFGNAAAIYTMAPTITSFSRYCGRALNPITSLTTNLSVCTKTAPFTVGVHFDSNEKTEALTMALNNELTSTTGGIVGFKLKYVQQSC